MAPIQTEDKTTQERKYTTEGRGDTQERRRSSDNNTVPLEKLLREAKRIVNLENLAFVIKRNKYFLSKADERSEKTALRRRARKASKRLSKVRKGNNS